MNNATNSEPITFEGLDIPFNQTNDDWVRTNLVNIRLATVMLRDNDSDLTAALQKMVPQGIVPELLDALTGTKEHLEAIVEVIDTVLLRSFVCLERLGFTPECPPPSFEEKLH